MGYPDYAAQIIGDNLADLSRWIDRHNAHRDAEAVTWGRIAKVSEEHGEAIAALILATGQNPRKPGDPEQYANVIKELLDVAVTALGAVEHMTGNTGLSVRLLGQHVEDVVKRAGLA